MGFDINLGDNRWSSAFRSDELFMNIKYVLDMFCEPYMQLFQVFTTTLDHTSIINRANRLQTN